MSEESPQANNSPQLEEAAELLKEIRAVEIDRRDALTRLSTNESGQRANLLRDLLTISVTLLIGAMTLYTVAPDLVKTPVLFFIALSFLLVGTIVNILGRIQILNYMNSATATIETYYANATGAIRQVMANQYNEDSLIRLKVFTEQEGPQLPPMKWMGKNSHLYSSAFLLVGLLGVGVSILLKVTV